VTDQLETWIERLVAPSSPHVPAFVDSKGCTLLTRGDFAERVRGAAAAYVGAGFAHGRPIGFGVRQDPAGIAWLIGALRAGVPIVVLDPGVAPVRLESQCRVAGVEAVVLDPVVAALAGSRAGRAAGRRLGLVLPDPRRLAASTWTTGRALGRDQRLRVVRGSDADRPLEPDAPAVVLFTSGTTGEPRSVVHSARSLAATLETGMGIVALRPGDLVLGAGLHLVVPALVAGATVVVPPRRVAATARVTRRLGVRHVSMPPHRAVAWAAAGGAAAALETVLFGSAPVRNNALRALRGSVPTTTAVRSVYGMTEQLLVATISAEERLGHDERRGDLVGHVVPGATVRVADDGEVWVGGRALARGTLGDVAPARELPTGDLGRLDEDGRLVLIGRRKEMLIRDGVNIYPALYEAPLANEANVPSVFLVGVPDDDANETVVLWVERARSDRPHEAQSRVRAALGSAASPVDRHAHPDHILEIDAIPRSGRSDKPDRRRLVQLAAERLGRTVQSDPVVPGEA
jgi:acyl-CoA synthetase (AMP-forming)/AMP-acid ligase II